MNARDRRAETVPEDGVIRCDIAIIGSGMGGATLAWALRDSGADVLVVERGDWLPRETENWSAEAVFVDGRYKNAEPWIDQRTGREFTPGEHYYVGGNTKMYGACLPRFREQDFDVVDHQDGVSPAWPISYRDMEAYYSAAENLYAVHGTAGGDPTEPQRSGPYPYPALEHEPPIAELANAMSCQGLHPFQMPMGVDWRAGGRCIRCATCDGFPCKLDAKSDADINAMRPAMASGVRLLTRTQVLRLESTPDGGRIAAAIAEHDGRRIRVAAAKFVLAAGAVHSPAILLRSSEGGLANSSGLVGRRYMVHNLTFFVAIDPRRRNSTSFQKTLGINDWYLTGPETPFPLGNLQMLGKLQADSVRAARPYVPASLLKYMTRHSMDILLTTEDLPRVDNRVAVLPNGRIGIQWAPTNLRPHHEFVRRMKSVMRKSGYPLIFTERMGIETDSHKCGTAVMGDDPRFSVVDRTCRTHDIPNLWIIDGSVFPSSTALNPALTIAANALRVAATGSLLD